MQLFDWQQPFTGAQPEISKNEQRRATRQFQEYAGQLLTQAAQRDRTTPMYAVERRIYVPASGREADYVHFQTMYPSFRNLERPEMYMRRKQPAHQRPPDGLGERVLRITGLAADSSSYQVDENDTLVRWDRTADYYSHLACNAERWGAGEAPGSIWKRQKAAESYQENRKLEMELGLNGQPVGLDELGSLLTVHESAQPDWTS
jgi:hypothetical protein